MDNISKHDQAIELLQDLGLKEYEARSFVALTRTSQATAKEISELSEVPRTRVYDAVQVLESKGLVEIQHANPQQFRAVSIDEGVETPQSEYQARAESLRETLNDIDKVERDSREEVTHEVWALSGRAATGSRTRQLVDEADEEIVLVMAHPTVVTDDIIDRLAAASERGASVIVGSDEEIRTRIEGDLPDAEVFTSGLEWLHGVRSADETHIGRLLLVDRDTILVSTIDDSGSPDQFEEHAVFGRGFTNGFVTIVRRLLATGLLPTADPGTDGE